MEKIKTRGLLILLLIAFFLRVWGIWFSLPYLYHPDEPKLVRTAVKILETGDPNPHYFFYPSFPFYIHSLLYLLFFSPFFSSLGWGKVYLNNPAPFYLLSRLFNAVIGTLVLLPLRSICRYFPSARNSFLPLIFFSIALLSVEVSHYATVDTLLVFFVTLSLFLILRAQEKDNILAYIWAAFACGVTGSVKYPGILTFFPLLLVLVENRRFTWIPFIFLTGLFSFSLVSPYILIDFPSFRRDLLKLLQFSRTGWSNGSPWKVYFLSLSQGLGVLLFPLALFGFFISLKEKKWRVILSFFLLYLLFLFTSHLAFPRFILPLFPLFSLFAFLGWKSISEKILNWRNPVLTFIILVTLFPSVVYISLLPLPDPRTVSLQWIEKNIPPGSKLALERYTPPVNVVTGYVEWRVKKDRYEVYPINYTLSIEEYRKKGIEYIIISSSMYERMKRYPLQKKFYSNLEKKGNLLAYFPPPHLWFGLEFRKPWIKIYRINL